jgi:hypothetical protein
MVLGMKPQRVKVIFARLRTPASTAPTRCRMTGLLSQAVIRACAALAGTRWSTGLAVVDQRVGVVAGQHHRVGLRGIVAAARDRPNRPAGNQVTGYRGFGRLRCPLSGGS